jgi:hypothetical protein
MSPTILPKEVLLPDWACWDMQGTKGDRVHFIDQSVPVLPVSLRHSIPFIIHRNEFYVMN